MSLQFISCFHLVILILPFVCTGDTNSTEYKYGYLSNSPSAVETSLSSAKLNDVPTVGVSNLDRFQVTTPPINLSLSDTNGTKEFKLTIPPNSVFIMNITVQSDTAFVLVQSHSLYYYLEMISDNLTIQGTNIGVVYVPKDSFSFFIGNSNKVSVNGLILITAYNKWAPVPGANIPPDEMIMAMPRLNVYLNVIKYNAVAALAVNENETTSKINYRLFYKYTAERDLSEESYFEGIRSMKTVEDMINNANEFKLPSLNNNVNSSINVSFANYPGNGIIFGLVAESGNASSVYVLTHTFGCNFTSDVNSCFFLVNTFIRVEMIVLCVTGLILCCCGFEWKTLELAVMTSLVVGIPTYTALYNSSSLQDNVMISSGTGIMLSCVFIFVVWYTKHVHLRHAVAFFALGTLISAVVMFLGIGNCAPFKSEGVYWATFFAIALSFCLVLFSNRSVAHYFSSGIVGSFLAVLTIDYFSGSSLKYIIFDNIRRVNVEDFIESNIDPPFQTPDVILAVLWVTVAIASVVYQCCGHLICCNIRINDLNLVQTSDEFGVGSDRTPLITPHPD